MSNERTARPDDPAWLVRAFTWEGLTEIVGGQHEPEILRFFGEVGHSWVKDDETAWCAAFVGAMLEREGIASTRQLNARSYTDWGTEVPPAEARRGDVAVFTRGNPDGWQGHVGFVLWVGDDGVGLLGGNQRNGVNVKAYPRDRLITIRRPGAAVGVKTVKAIQRTLAALGYHEVGAVDGDYGPRTRAAIMAFEADNGLPVTGEIAAGLLDRIMEAPPRQVGEARATGKPVGSRIVKGSELGIAATGLTGVAAAAKELTPVIEQVEGVGDTVKAARRAAEPFLPFLGDLWPLILVGGLVAVAWLFWRSRAARIEDHRRGKTA